MNKVILSSASPGLTNTCTNTYTRAMETKCKKLKAAIKRFIRRRRRDYIPAVEGSIPRRIINGTVSRCKVAPGYSPCSTRFVEDKYVLSTAPWYWPEISCENATSMMELCPDGTFLVRRSETSGFAFSFTYKIGGIVGNARVYCKNGLFGLCHDDRIQPREPTLKLLVERLLTTKDHEQLIMVYRETGEYVRAIPLKLEHPLQREISLMDHCRRFIMRSVDKPEDVWQFDLPRKMKMFLLELKDME